MEKHGGLIVQVAHLSTEDIRGGAARATFRLHHALRERGLQADLLAMLAATDAPGVIRVPQGAAQKAFAQLAGSLDILPTKMYRRQAGQTTFSPGWVRGLAVDRLPEVRRADLISLFWVCGGYLSVKTIGRLLKLKKPVVWRLSDMWPFTGGCHYSFGCDRYEAHCGHCPQLSSSWKHDLSWLVMKRKQRWWQGESLTVVCPSRWLAACVRRSALFREVRVEIIPSGVDTRIFKPRNQALARDLLQLPQEAPLILFGAINPLDDRRKGGLELAAALTLLAQKPDLGELPHLVIFGTWKKPEIPGWTKPIHVLGRLADDASLALAYAAADVFVAPSLEDNLPNTVIEAMSCGLPCVAFNTGGLPDLIEAEETGYLATPGRSEDLARGIAWVLADRQRRQNLGQKARAMAERSFDLAEVARRYEALYQELVSLEIPH